MTSCSVTSLWQTSVKIENLHEESRACSGRGPVSSAAVPRFYMMHSWSSQGPIVSLHNVPTDSYSVWLSMRLCTDPLRRSAVLTSQALVSPQDFLTVLSLLFIVFYESNFNFCPGKVFYCNFDVSTFPLWFSAVPKNLWTTDLQLERSLSYRTPFFLISLGF